MNYKNVLIVGFGVTGQAAANFLTQNKIKNTVVDSKARTDFDENVVTKLETGGQTSFIFGNTEVSNIEDYDLVIVSPGVKPSNLIVQKAKEANIEIHNDVTLFLEEWKKIGTTIGVTGSNGKSTIVTLLYNMLIAADREAILVGNIGASPLDYLLSYKKGEKSLESTTNKPIAVIELSSYQLELFKPEYGVDIAIIANISSNHLDRYYDDFQLYANAKLNIIEKGRTKIVLDLDDRGIQKYVLPQIKDLKKDLYGVSLSTNEGGEFDPEIISNLKLPGRHNLYNVALCLKALEVLGIEVNEKIKKSVIDFPGLSHRIEFITELNGVRYINDSKSTSPASTNAAIETVSEKTRDIKNIILITGGEDKGMNFNLLKDNFEQFVKFVLILPGNSLEKIVKVCKDLDIEYVLVSDMKEAVKLAKERSVPGDIVLLSPSTSSLNTYKSFEARGDDFRNQVLG